MNLSAAWTGVVVILLTAGAGFSLWWFPFSWLTLTAILLPLPPLLLLWRWMSKGARNRYHSRSHTRSLQDPRVLARLKENLTALGAQQSVEQLDQLSDKFEDLGKVLKLQFNEDELTYVRYQQSAEMVRISVLENIREMEVALNSVRSIDSVRLRKKLSALHKQSHQRALAETETLQKRLDVYTRQTERVQTLLLENETALTALSNTAVALADIKSGSGGEKPDAEAAIAELERMAQRAARYQSNWEETQ